MWSYLRKLNIELPYNPAIPLLDIYLDKTFLKKDTCTHIAALFTITKTWKQPKCPWTDDWIKMWYIYTMEYYSAIKRNKTMPFSATWMELETLILSEVRKTNTIWYHLYLESNIWHKWTFPQKRNSRTWRTDLWLPKGRGREWDGLGVWVSRGKLLHLEWISNEILLYSTENYI